MSFFSWIKTLFSKPKMIDTGWKFKAEVIGDDVLVRDTTATWFGGEADVESGDDNGETASGIDTVGNPGLMGCALPVIVRDASGRLKKSTCTSPIAVTPHLPWKTMVEVTCGAVTITVPLLDNGPTKGSGDGIDLTQAAFKAFGRPLSQGVIKGISYKILGVARYMDYPRYKA